MRLALLILLCSSLFSKAATYTAANPTIGAVSNALALCAAVGDTVQIPAGTASWTNGLYVTNAVAIIGAGRGVTIISNRCDDGNVVTYRHPFYFDLRNHSSTSYFGNLTIAKDDNQSTTNYLVFAMQIEGDNKDGRRMVITNTHFYSNLNNTIRIESALGVISGCQFDLPSGGVAVYGFHRTWNGGADGNGSWSTNVPSGSDQMWYIEDCGFNFLPQGFTYTTIDGFGGWRYCARYCMFTNTTMEGHGIESGWSRGTRYVEGYMNRFVNTNGGQVGTFLRSGEQIYFSNTFDGVSGTGPFKLLVDRMWDDLSYYGGATGRAPVDSNTTAIVTGTATGGGALFIDDTTKTWTPDEHIGRTVRKTSGQSVSSLTRSGGTITIDFAAAHGLGNPVNKDITIAGADQFAYNRSYRGRDLTYVDADTITTVTSDTPTSPATGTIFMVTNGIFGYIASNTTTRLYIQPGIYSPTMDFTGHSGDTYEINKVTMSMDQPGAGITPLLSGTPPSLTGFTQALAMCFAWNNTNTSGTAMGFSPSMNTIVPGLHFTNAVKSGYTPHTYPHPLLSAAGSEGGGGGSQGGVPANRKPRSGRPTLFR